MPALDQGGKKSADEGYVSMCRCRLVHCIRCSANDNIRIENAKAEHDKGDNDEGYHLRICGGHSTDNKEKKETCVRVVEIQKNKTVLFCLKRNVIRGLRDVLDVEAEE